jgi:hypothetical protein
MIRAMLAVTVVVIAVNSSLLSHAHAGSITVNATDDIFGAGQVSGSSVVLNQSTGGGSGTAPNGFGVVGGAVVSFSSVIGSISCPAISSEGCVSLALGSLNDPDGTSNTVTGPTSYSGADNISGITAPGVGYLVGVFLASGGPSGSAPTALDFTSGGSPGSTAFSSLSPQLDQTFFIGDGLTGDGTGSQQSFVAPAGATMLFLGVADSANFTSPGFYLDNSGTYAVTYSTALVPEPTSLVLLAAGLIGMAAFCKSRSGKK